MEQEQKAPEQTLEDIGTRYQHLLDHCEALEACVEVLRSRGVYTPADKERLVKISIAAEVARATVDTYTGIKAPTAEYALYRMLKNIPKNPESIVGGRGTPLK
jgi:hypothetical protein